MCSIYLFYSIIGEGSLKTTYVSSNDGFYKQCFANLVSGQAGYENNYDGASSFRGNVSFEDCYKSLRTVNASV